MGHLQRVVDATGFFCFVLHLLFGFFPFAIQNFQSHLHLPKQLGSITNYVCAFILIHGDNDEDFLKKEKTLRIFILISKSNRYSCKRVWNKADFSLDIHLLKKEFIYLNIYPPKLYHDFSVSLETFHLFSNK